MELALLNSEFLNNEFGFTIAVCLTSFSLIWILYHHADCWGGYFNFTIMQIVDCL